MKRQSDTFNDCLVAGCSAGETERHLGTCGAISSIQYVYVADVAVQDGFEVAHAALQTAAGNSSELRGATELLNIQHLGTTTTTKKQTGQATTESIHDTHATISDERTTHELMTVKVLDIRHNYHTQSNIFRHVELSNVHDTSFKELSKTRV
jgi:hypothetical protein